MDWKQWTAVFIMFFAGMWGILTVDQHCHEVTGQGGKLGLSLSRTVDGKTAFCFFGLEGEIGR